MDGFRPCKFSTGCGYEVCVPEFCDAYDPKIETNADRIRAMNDKDLVDFLWRFNGVDFENVLPFCKNTVECGEKLDSSEITGDMCKQCLLDKLQQPCEEETV